jgi:hypothetical protein
MAEKQKNRVTEGKHGRWYSISSSGLRGMLTMIILLFTVQLPAQTQRKGSMKKPFELSQQFKHSAGAGVGAYRVNGSDELFYQIAYNPSLSLTRSFSDFSFSVGSELKAGYHPSTGVDSFGFVVAQLPLLLELNFGNNASKDFYSDQGWFFGGGWSYNLFNEEWNHGPVVTLGIRTFLFGPSWSVRYSRYFAMQETDRSMHNLTLLLNLGKYFEQVKLNNKVSRFSDGFRRR